MKRIHEVKKPVLGRIYLVPCIYSAPHKSWFPVFGPRHEDLEIIGFEHEHYHFDMRFVTVRQLKAWGNLFAQMNYSICAANMTRVQTGVLGQMRVVWKPRKCLREMPDFPKAKAGSWPEKLEEKYGEARLACMICPHRGMPLDGLPVRNGVVICPGHGLAWNVESGRLVRRY